MERKVGEKFKDGDNWIKVYKYGECAKCFYDVGDYCNKDSSIAGSCAPFMRSDNVSVTFKKTKK